jgi:hypothetical protein
MATYSDQATVAASEAFIGRVQMAMLTHAQFRVQIGDDAQGYATLGKAILNAPDTYAPLFANVVATQPVVQDDLAPPDGAAIPDASILSAVETVYPGFVR